MRSFFITALLFFWSMVQAQEWQWSVSLDSAVSSETNAPCRAFLWIPPHCKKVRGLVVGQHNMLEEGIFEHADFRKTMADLGFAEIWISPNLSIVFDFGKKDKDNFNDMLRKLGDASGYAELVNAPIIPIGHSALASYPWNFAAGNPERTLAILSIHGDAPLTPLTGSGRPNPDWGDRTIDGIPGLMAEGEYEWWIDRVKPALDYRQQHPQAPVSFLGDAGHGHFDYSDALVDYLCLFIRKAAQYRLPPEWPLNQAPVLKPVDPANGWLADRWRPDSLPLAKAAPHKEYKGAKAEAFWYFDKETAEATERYYAAARGKKPQYIGFVQGDTLLAFNEKLHARITPKFVPLSDGVSFLLSAAFTDTLRKAVIGDHSKSKIDIKRICGPVVKINDTTFSIRFYRMGLNNPKRTGDIWLIATNNGNAKYKSTVQQANIRIPYPNTAGKEQHIRFPALLNVKSTTKSVPLNATSDSGMPVYYYVMEGPAEIKGNKISFTKIPLRSKYPVKVTVVAWQYGRSIEPRIKTAEPVFQTFYINQ